MLIEPSLGQSLRFLLENCLNYLAALDLNKLKNREMRDKSEVSELTKLMGTKFATEMDRKNNVNCFVMITESVI